MVGLGQHHDPHYLVFRDRSMIIDYQTATYRATVVIGPFADKAAISHWIETQVVPTHYGYAHYLQALSNAEVRFIVGNDTWVQRYCERQHVLTPDAALPVVRDIARLRQLILTAPVAITPAPITLWDMMTDTQESINE